VAGIELDSSPPQSQQSSGRFSTIGIAVERITTQRNGLSGEALGAVVADIVGDDRARRRRELEDASGVRQEPE
jgi:hypothetical protein